MLFRSSLWFLCRCIWHSPSSIYIMTKEIVQALIAHAEGHIAKHVMNVNVYMSNAVGVGEHSDILETIEQELESISKYDDQLEMLNKYFK